MDPHRANNPLWRVFLERGELGTCDVCACPPRLTSMLRTCGTCWRNFCLACYPGSNCATAGHSIAPGYLNTSRLFDNNLQIGNSSSFASNLLAQTTRICRQLESEHRKIVRSIVAGTAGNLNGDLGRQMIQSTVLRIGGSLPTGGIPRLANLDLSELAKEMWIIDRSPAAQTAAQLAAPPPPNPPAGNAKGPGLARHQARPAPNRRPNAGNKAAGGAAGPAQSLDDHTQDSENGHQKVLVVSGQRSSGLVRACNKQGEAQAFQRSQLYLSPMRTLLAAALLPASKNVLVIGGGSGPNATAQTHCEKLDTRNGGLLSAASLPQPLMAHAACESGGNVYVIGGQRGRHNNVGAVLRYNETADSWTSLAGAPNALPYPSAVPTGSGASIAVFGGETLRQPPGWLFDPTTGAWTALPLIQNLQAAFRGSAAAEANGRIFVCGGIIGDSAAVFTLDPRQGLWSRHGIPQLNQGRYGHSLHYLNGDLVAVGGIGLFAERGIETLDPRGGPWTEQATALATVTYHAGACLIDV